MGSQMNLPRSMKVGKKCPVCGKRSVYFHSNDLAIGLVCRECPPGTYEKVIKWK